MRLLFVGFGTVGQGLAELLLEKKEILTKEFGLTWQTVGILDKKLGNVVAPCLLYTSPSPRDVEESRMPSSA